MQMAPLVARHVAEVVHGNWTDINLDDTLADVTYEEAVATPPGIVNSIAMLTNHLMFYNQVVIERIKGIDPAINDANGFDITINNEEQWQQLKQGTFASFKALAEMVANLTEEKLFGPTPNGHYSFYQTFHGIAEHAHYHLGQIMLVKKIIRATK
jgi:hypothetical protein